MRPKRMAKLDGKVVVEAACNNGSSALVTASGHLYIFGKDSIHSEGTSGAYFFHRSSVHAP